MHRDEQGLTVSAMTDPSDTSDKPSSDTPKSPRTEYPCEWKYRDRVHRDLGQPVEVRLVL